VSASGEDSEDSVSCYIRDHVLEKEEGFFGSASPLHVRPRLLSERS
jgi:hypothetical protein